MKSFLKRVLGPTNSNRIRGLQYYIQSLYLSFGDRVECNVCGQSFFHFLRYAGLDNVWCPKCKSLDRHRLLYEFLDHEMGFFASRKKVLHFAPEACFEKKFRQSHDYVSADLAVSLLPHVSARPDKVMSVTNIEFDDYSFDVVLCNHVLEHVENDKLAMQEIYRVLKKNGWAIIQVPINNKSAKTLEDRTLTPAERARQYGFEDHLRFYGRDYPKLLAANGFIVEERDFVKQLDSKRFRLNEKEIIYLCRKK